MLAVPIVASVRELLYCLLGCFTAPSLMHRDPLLSTAVRPPFHWGHRWVVMGITVRAFDKTWCLPVLVRLYRSKQRCAADGRPHRTCQELAAELLAPLAKALPDRQGVMVGDAAYTNRSLIKGRPSNVTILGRARLDAAIDEPPPPRRPRQMGRPRVRGARLPSPQAQPADSQAAWRRVPVTVYGRTVTVRVLVIDLLSDVAGGSSLMRLVLVRGFPGHERNDLFVSTDGTMSAADIIETFALRWSLEVTFHDAKGKLPQNRNEKAVARTAPMALWCYRLTVLWYLTTGQRLPIPRITNGLPWYPRAAPTFADMPATLRRRRACGRGLPLHSPLAMGGAESVLARGPCPIGW